MATGNGALLGVRVLVVDDDRDTRELSRAALQVMGGASVTTVSSEREALALFERGPHPHVVVTDTTMDHLDGGGLMARIRALPPERGGLVRVIALTAPGRGAATPSPERFDAHLQHPIDPVDLCATVARVVQGGHRSAAA